MTAILESYQSERSPHVAAAERIGFAVKRLTEHFTGRAAEDLTPAAIRQYAAARPVQPSTVARELTVLRAALRYAVRMGRLRAAPAIEIPPQAAPRERWLTPEEGTKLLAACGLPHLKLFVLLALGTGARRGAILDLRWEQVDLTQARIDFNAPGRRQTAKRRPVVPIAGPLLAALKKARKKAKTPFVVEYHGEGLKGIRRAFGDACRTAGLEDVTPHTLRHTAATWMAQDGVPLAMTAGVLGQSIARTTERYVKHHPDYLKAGIDVLGSRLKGLARNRLRYHINRDDKRRKAVKENDK